MFSVLHLPLRQPLLARASARMVTLVPPPAQPRGLAHTTARSTAPTRGPTTAARTKPPARRRVGQTRRVLRPTRWSGGRTVLLGLSSAATPHQPRLQALSSRRRWSSASLAVAPKPRRPSPNLHREVASTPAHVCPALPRVHPQPLTDWASPRPAARPPPPPRQPQLPRVQTTYVVSSVPCVPTRWTWRSFER